MSWWQWVWVLICWPGVAIPVGLAIARSVRIAEKQRLARCIGFERQCGFRYPDGERCAWYNGHHWPHDRVSTIFPMLGHG